MAFDLDLSTVRATAKNTLATPWLMAKVAKVAKESAQNQPKPPETLATLAGLATLAISQQRLKTFQEAAAAPAQPSTEAAPAPQKAVSRWCGADQQPPAIEAIDQAPPTPKKPLALDPGARALLALVTAYCDRTAASDKARAQWVDDVESTPNELRADLCDHLRKQMPPAPPAPPTAASTRPPAPAKPMGWLHLDQPWRAADRAYQRHHWQCSVCKAAARGHSERCTEGQRLHDEYTSEGHHHD